MYPVKNYSEHSFCGIMSSFILYFICREMAIKLLILLLISLFTVPHLLPSAYSFLFPPSDQALPHILRSMLAFFSYSHDAKVEISIHPRF